MRARLIKVNDLLASRHTISQLCDKLHLFQLKNPGILDGPVEFIVGFDHLDSMTAIYEPEQSSGDLDTVKRMDFTNFLVQSKILPRSQCCF